MLEKIFHNNSKSIKSTLRICEAYHTAKNNIFLLFLNEGSIHSVNIGPKWHPPDVLQNEHTPHGIKTGWYFYNKGPKRKFRVIHLCSYPFAMTYDIAYTTAGSHVHS